MLNEQRFIFVRNGQRFPLLLGTNNAVRIFMVLSETKSALVIKISRRYCLFTVRNSDLFSICFLGRLDFFSGDIAKNFGQHDSGLGRHDFGRDGPVIVYSTSVQMFIFYRDQVVADKRL